MTPDLDRLLVLAEAAQNQDNAPDWPDTVRWLDGLMNPVDFGYIAAADPTTIASLIRRLIAAETVVERADYRLSHSVGTEDWHDAYWGLRECLAAHAAAKDPAL